MRHLGGPVDRLLEGDGQAVDALEKKCSALAQELDLQNLHIDAPSVTLSAEGKSRNGDSSTSEMLQIQVPRISELPGPIMNEFATAMDEFTAVIEGTPVGAWTPRCSFLQNQCSARTCCYHYYEPEAQSTRDGRESAGYALPTEQLLQFPNHIPQHIFR